MTPCGGSPFVDLVARCTSYNTKKPTKKRTKKPRHTKKPTYKPRYKPTPAPACTNLPQANPDYPNYDVIVVGVGMSGLSAAATLIQRGKRVLVLVGRDEVGGCMRTMTGFGKAAGDIYKGTIELGANWFYGGYGELGEYDDPTISGPINPMKNFALDANVAFMEELVNGKTIDMYDLTRKQQEDRRLPFRQVREALRDFRPKNRCLEDDSRAIFSELGDSPNKSLGSDSVREALDQ